MAKEKEKRGEIGELADLVKEAQSILITILGQRFRAPPGWTPNTITEWLERAAAVQHEKPLSRCRVCARLELSHPNAKCEDFVS
jgi:hypothetical protein